MQPWIGRPAVALLAVVASSPARAGDRPDPRVYRAALAAWQGCFPEGAPVPGFPEVPDADDAGSGLTVRRTRAGFQVEEYGGGSGVEALYGGTRIDFQPTGCRALWVRDATYDGALARRMRIGWINRPAPGDGDLRLLAGEPARANDPAHAFARAWLTHACPGGPDSELEWKRAIEGPIAPAQPWHPGAPGQAPATFWSTAALDAIGSPAPLRPSDDDDELPPGKGPELTGILVPVIGRPARTITSAGVELFEAEIPGRNGGRAIALRDPVANRHRWVVVTRGCVQGTTVEWLGAVGTRIVGVTRSWHGRYGQGDAILVIDVPSGTAWAVRLPEPIRDAALDGGGKLRAWLSSSRVTLRRGKVRATIDLAPLLTSLPVPR